MRISAANERLKRLKEEKPQQNRASEPKTRKRKKKIRASNHKWFKEEILDTTG